MTTPAVPITNEGSPAFLNCLNVNSNPALKRSIIPPISKKVSRTKFSLTGPEKRGSPAKTIRPPIAKGPKITPASISPITSGSFILLKIRANIFAVTINKLIAKIVVIGLNVDN